MKAERFEIDERPRHLLLDGESERGNHRLTRIDRHIAGRGGGVVVLAGRVRVVTHGFRPNDDRRRWQGFNRFLDTRLKRLRQRHRQTVKRLGQQYTSDFNRKVSTAMDDREHGDPWTELEKRVGHRSSW